MNKSHAWRKNISLNYAPPTTTHATLLFSDGVAYMADCPTNSVDVIIVDSTDPIGPAKGLFNRTFYESCFRALKNDGLLIQQSESPLALLELIKEMRHEMSKAGFKAFKTLPFPQPCYPTGWWSVTYPANNPTRTLHFAKPTPKPNPSTHCTTTHTCIMVYSPPPSSHTH